jgi:hypothetical protein
LIIYTRADGSAVNSFSYSQFDLDTDCPRKFLLMRGLGYDEIPRGAALDFGICLEAAVKAFHTMGVTARESFEQSWALKKDKELRYTTNDKSWDNLNRVGEVLLSLYENIAGKFLHEPVFYMDWENRSQRDDFLPGTPLVCVPDIVDWPPSHKRWGGGSRLIDVKTSANAYRSEPDGICSMDPQLKIQSWVMKVPRVAFMVFVKGKTEVERTKGARFTLVERVPDVPIDVGATVVCCAALPKKQADALKELAVFEIYTEKQQKEYKALPKEQQKNRKPGALVPQKNLSCARIQFIEGRVDEREVEGLITLMRESASVLSSRSEAYRRKIDELQKYAPGLSIDVYKKALRGIMCETFPQRSGMRFPDDKCSGCHLLGHCLGDEKLLEARAVQRSEAWMEE